MPTDGYESTSAELRSRAGEHVAIARLPSASSLQITKLSNHVLGGNSFVTLEFGPRNLDGLVESCPLAVVEVVGLIGRNQLDNRSVRQIHRLIEYEATVAYVSAERMDHGVSLTPL